MLTTIRAAISVVLLLFFYVFAFAIIGGLAAVSVWGWQEHGGPAVAKLSYVTIAVAAAVVVAVWKVARAKPEPEPGVILGPDQAPELWEQVRSLATEAKTRMPDEIRLIAGINAAVDEDTRLLGLIGGRRRLYVGAPLVQGLTVGQIRSVIAHELGHYSHRHTRLGAVAYRGHATISATVRQLGGVIGWLFSLYARLYFLVEVAVRRRQEIEADAASVRVAGRAVAQSALRELPVLVAAWSFYESRYLEGGWQAGYAPRGFFSGFGRLLEARQDELANLRAAEAPSEASKWDSHPPISARIAAMAALPDSAAPADDRLASALFPAFDAACEKLAGAVVQVGDRPLVSWDEFTASAISAGEQRQADQIYRTAARLDGQSTDLDGVLRLVEAGRLGELAEHFFPNATRKEAREQFGEAMELLLRVAAVRSGAGTWRHSWSGPATFVRSDGAPLDLAAVAAEAISPEAVGAARARLDDLGIDVTRATIVDLVATAHGGDIIGAMANVKVNDVPHDLFVLDNGLILKPCPKSTDHGKQRLIQVLQSAPLVELAEANTFVPLEEIATATVAKEIPIRLELTLHDGREFSVQETWSGESISKDSREALKAVVAPYLAGAAVPTP